MLSILLLLINIDIILKKLYKKNIYILRETSQRYGSPFLLLNQKTKKLCDFLSHNSDFGFSKNRVM